MSNRNTLTLVVVVLLIAVAGWFAFSYRANKEITASDNMRDPVTTGSSSVDKAASQTTGRPSTGPAK